MAYGAYMSIDREAGLLTFSLYRVCDSCEYWVLELILLQSSNSLEAFKQAKEVVSGLVDGTVSSVFVENCSR